MDKKAKSELQTVTGISNFSDLTPEQHNQLLTQFFNKEFSPRLFAALIELAPAILTSLTDITKQAVEQIENAGKAQLALIEVLKQQAKTVDSLKDVALRCKSDKCRMKIADDIVHSTEIITTTIKDINEQNNSFWQKFWATTGKVLASILGIVIVGIAVGAGAQGKQKS